MRKLVIGMALASTAIASPALARDDAWYVEVDGGVMIVEDLEFDVNGILGFFAVHNSSNPDNQRRFRIDWYE